MSFRLFLNQINNEDRKLFQKLISLCKKRIKLERSKKYLEICIKNILMTNRKKIIFLSGVVCSISARNFILYFN